MKVRYTRGSVHARTLYKQTHGLSGKFQVRRIEIWQQTTDSGRLRVMPSCILTRTLYSLNSLNVNIFRVNTAFIYPISSVSVYIIS